MKRKLTAVTAAMLSLALMTGCSGPGGGGKGNKAGDTIKVGVNYELSGPVAQYGEASVHGIELAAEEINKNGGINGKKIELVKYDNKSEPAEATNLATKLMTQDKVVAILGPATSGSFKAEIPVATKNKVPIISGSATADDVTVDKSGKVQEFVFRTCFSDSFQGTAMANFASQKLNAKTAVIINDNSSDYAKGLKENFEKQFTQAGGKIVGSESYVAGDTDFNAILTKVKGLNFDVLYLPGYYNEAGLIIKSARALGINQPILGGDGFDSPKLTDLAGASALSDIYYTNHYSALDKDPKVTDFIKASKEKYNQDPNSFQALGYDEMMFLADAIKRVGNDVTSLNVQKALAETKDFVGVTGKFSVDEKHNAIKSTVVVSLKDGKPVTSEKVEVK